MSTTITYGTSYFVSHEAAVRYYAEYEADPRRAVRIKLEEGSIHIGKPPLKDGETLRLVDGGLRYAVESAVDKLMEQGTGKGSYE